MYQTRREFLSSADSRVSSTLQIIIKDKIVGLSVQACIASQKTGPQLMAATLSNFYRFSKKPFIAEKNVKFPTKRIS